MIEQSKRRGRPVTGQALTPAEKQKAYRQRLANKPSYHDSDLFVARRAYDDSLSTIKSYKKLVLELQATMTQTDNRIKQLESELAKRDAFIKEFVDYCGLYASVMPREDWVKKAKTMFSKKVTLPKYKQVDIED